MIASGFGVIAMAGRRRTARGVPMFRRGLCDGKRCHCNAAAYVRAVPGAGLHAQLAADGGHAIAHVDHPGTDAGIAVADAGAVVGH